MLQEYSISPDLFSPEILNDKVSFLILREFLKGMVVNGLVADLNKSQWQRSVFRNIDENQPAVRDQVLSIMKVLSDRNRIIRHPKKTDEQPVNSSTWVNLALDPDTLNCLNGILVDDRLYQEFHGRSDLLLNLPEVLDSSAWDSMRRRTKTTTRNMDGFSDLLKPVLRYARKTMLIDPYISLKDRYKNTIDLCAALQGNREGERLVGRVQIHTDVKSQTSRILTSDVSEELVENLLDRWEEYLHPLSVRYGHQYEVYFWTDTKKSGKMHDRFILTDQCGLSFPYGLDIVPNNDALTTDVSLLDENVRALRWGDYSINTEKFNLVGMRSIVK